MKKNPLMWFCSFGCWLLSAQFTQVGYSRYVTQKGKGRGDLAFAPALKGEYNSQGQRLGSRYNEHYGAEQIKGAAYSLAPAQPGLRLPP